MLTEADAAVEVAALYSYTTLVGTNCLAVAAMFDEGGELAFGDRAGTMFAYEVFGL